MQGLTFELTGELGHFRNLFTHSFLETMIAPPKTTVVGMIGAALGYDELQTMELTDKLRIGVKVLQIKGFIKEITTFFNYKSKPPETTPIMRELIVNPKYKIYVASDDTTLLNQVREALEHPVYPIYLGISDLIGYITQIQDIELSECKAKHFDCIIPLTDDINYVVRVKESVSGVMIPPKIFRVPKKFEIKGRGRSPKSLQNVLMFFGYQIELSKELDAYKTSKGEVIVLI